MSEQSFEEFMPNMVRQMFDIAAGPTEELIKFLGESPEAWRGALAFCDHMRAGSGMVMDTCKESQASKAASLAILASVITAALYAFDTHPTSRIMRQTLANRDPQ